MHILYNILLYLLVPVLFLRMGIKQFKTRKLQKNSQHGRWKERIGFISDYPYNTTQPIWIHTVSVGEFIAVLPLINLLRQNHPSIPLVITTTTMTGSDQVIKNLGNTVFHVYIPWDLPGAMARFYNTIKPQIALIMETEIWPNLLYQAHKRSIPVLLINARMSEKSFKSYQKIAGFSHSIINYFSHVCVQNNKDSKRLHQLGIAEEKLTITGNIKFDLTIKQELIDLSNNIKQLLQWQNNPVLLASSTHQGEDQLMLSLFKVLRKNNPQLKLILVARHPERFKDIELLANKQSKFVCRRSNIAADFQQPCDILIGDSLGEMVLYYNLATIVVMGGTFIAHGGHNILEPAALGKAIFYGPSMYNFATINDLFLSSNASIQVEDMDKLAEVISEYMDNPKKIQQMGMQAKKLIDKNSGSKDKIYQIIKPYLSDFSIV